MYTSRSCSQIRYGPLTRNVKLWVAHAPRMPGTFSPPPRVNDPGMHHGTCVTHVPWCMPGSLTSGFLWSRCRGKRSQHTRRIHNPQFYLSGKRPKARIMISCPDTRAWESLRSKASIFLLWPVAKWKISIFHRSNVQGPSLCWAGIKIMDIEFQGILRKISTRSRETQNFF